MVPNAKLQSYASLHASWRARFSGLPRMGDGVTLNRCCENGVVDGFVDKKNVDNMRRTPRNVRTTPQSVPECCTHTPEGCHIAQPRKKDGKGKDRLAVGSEKVMGKKCSTRKSTVALRESRGRRSRSGAATPSMPEVREPSFKAA